VFENPSRMALPSPQLIIITPSVFLQMFDSPPPKSIRPYIHPTGLTGVVARSTIDATVDAASR
jgi:hypothetical protein